MIPLKDTIPSRTYPFVNIFIIILNILAFAYELSLGKRLDMFILSYGVIPIKFYYLLATQPFNFLNIFFPFLSSIFLHGGWIHIIGNMLYLWIFGDNVEDRMGHLRYFAFYIICGVLAGGVHLYTNPTSGVPTIGASGAIAGVMGAYFIMFPGSRIITFVPIFFFFQIIEIPAFFFIGFWFLVQFFSGSLFLSSAGQNVGGVAWWAHVGGFVCGMVLVFFFRKRKRSYKVFRDQI